MAIFRDVDLEPGTAPQTAWARLRDELLDAESVEVIKRIPDAGPVGFVFRIWSGPRADGSNTLQADPDQEY